MTDIYKKYGWGKRYYLALSGGNDHGYAAWVATCYCERQARKDKKDKQ